MTQKERRWSASLHTFACNKETLIFSKVLRLLNTLIYRFSCEYKYADIEILHAIYTYFDHYGHINLFLI